MPVERVVACTSVQFIVAGNTTERIVIVTAEQPIIPGLPIEDIVSIAANQSVVSVSTHDEIVSVAAFQPIISVLPEDFRVHQQRVIDEVIAITGNYFYTGDVAVVERLLQAGVVVDVDCETLVVRATGQ